MLAFLSKYVFVFVSEYIVLTYDRATVLRGCVVRLSLTCFRTPDFRLSGDEEIRTLDPLLARQVLSQLSYTPI